MPPRVWLPRLVASKGASRLSEMSPLHIQNLLFSNLRVLATSTVTYCMDNIIFILNKFGISFNEKQDYILVTEYMNCVQNILRSFPYKFRQIWEQPLFKSLDNHCHADRIDKDGPVVCLILKQPSMLIAKILNRKIKVYSRFISFT